MGRPPDAYATDSLLALLDGRSGSANADVLLAAGELIAAAVFADETSAHGIPAVALCGAQAGIVTDERFGDATIVRVEPRAVVELLDAVCFPSSRDSKDAARAARSRRSGAAAPIFRRSQSVTRCKPNASTCIPTSAAR